MTQLTWNKMPSWIAREGVLRDLSPSSVKVLVALLSGCDESGSVRMSQGSVADLAGVVESTVQRSIQSLAEFGVISIVEKSIGRCPALINCSPRSVAPATTPPQRSTRNYAGATEDKSLATHPQLRPRSVAPATTRGLERVAPATVRGLDTYIGTPVRRKEEREREIISPSVFKTWHPKARMVLDDPESAAAFEAFDSKFAPDCDDEQDRPRQIVAMALTRHPKALKVGWTIPRLVELAEAVQTHQHLTAAQAWVEMQMLDKSKTRMGIPQHDEVIEAIAKCERVNLSRERLGGVEMRSKRDAEFVIYAKKLNKLQISKLLLATRNLILQEPDGENNAARHWDRRLGTDPLGSLRHDWLADTAGGRWLRSRAIETIKTKETA